MQPIIKIWYNHIDLFWVACAWRTVMDFILQQEPLSPQATSTRISFWAETDCEESQTSPCSAETRRHYFQQSIRCLGSKSNVMSIVVLSLYCLNQSSHIQLSATSMVIWQELLNYTIIIDIQCASSVFQMFYPSVINK